MCTTFQGVTYVSTCFQVGCNAMHSAAEGGQLEVIKFLAPYFGTRVSGKDGAGLTVLHWAAMKSHCAVARYLIEELKLDPQDRDEVSVCVHVCVCVLCVCKMGSISLCQIAYIPLAMNKPFCMELNISARSNNMFYSCVQCDRYSSIKGS